MRVSQVPEQLSCAVSVLLLWTTSGWGLLPLGKEGCGRERCHGLKPVVSEEKLLPRISPREQCRGVKDLPVSAG